MMFFRRKDLADVEQIFRSQGPQFNRVWVQNNSPECTGPATPPLGLGRTGRRPAGVLKKDACPGCALCLVLEWASEHRAELRENWKIAEAQVRCEKLSR